MKHLRRKRKRRRKSLDTRFLGAGRARGAVQEADLLPRANPKQCSCGLAAGGRRLPSAAQLKCSFDELVVGRYPAVGREDHELEAGAEHLAIR